MSLNPFPLSASAMIVSLIKPSIVEPDQKPTTIGVDGEDDPLIGDVEPASSEVS